MTKPQEPGQKNELASSCTQTRSCRVCGRVNSPDAIYCGECGRKFFLEKSAELKSAPIQETICGNCGGENILGAIYCAKCGAKIHLKTQTEWKAKSAFICYLMLTTGVFMGGIITALILRGLSLNLQTLDFPYALISVPINEVIILVITFLFARQKGAGLKHLGFKKPNLKILAIASSAALLLLSLALIIGLLQETILGPDPNAEILADAIRPRSITQLTALIIIDLALVGPIEELAFRGFVQKGFENSFGKTTGLLITSVLFGLLHGLNSFRSILPVTAASLVLGYFWQKTDENTIAAGWMHGVYDTIAITITYFAYA